MKKTFLIFLFFCLICGMKAQSVDFLGENINITVRHDSVTVEAMYFFKTTDPAPVNIMIFYPVSKVGERLQLGNIQVTSVDQGVPVEYELSDEGLGFGIVVIPNEEARYRVTYTQKRGADEFRYILTSTRAWGKALKFSHFSVTAPKSYPKIGSYSYEPTFTQDMGKTLYHEWSFKDFMPEKDFVINFE
jgi:hypothetical protein